MKLTDSFLRNIKGTGAIQKHFDGGGLYLFVSAKGAKIWRMAYRYANKQKTLVLGPYPALTLREARKKREETKKALFANIDPCEQKKALRLALLTKDANTFEVIAREWLATHAVHLSDKYRAKSLSRLERHLFPHIGKMSIGEVEAQNILVPVRDCERRGQNETAHKLVQMCGQVMRYAIATGRAKHNVAADLRGALQPINVQHRASITDPKGVGALLRAIEGYGGYFPVLCALRLAPYVFLRPGELRQAEWAEINMTEAEWRIPACKMKMRQVHIVPLSHQALSILKELYPFTGHGKYLFPSVRTLEKPITDVTLLAALRRMGYKQEEMCVHGFRSLASTLLNEQGYNRDWIERQLAHAERDGVRAAYNYAEYLPERRRMMQEWADYLDRLRWQTPPTATTAEAIASDC